MKCPKCGYMSFDFNEICPKCQRNIISEREKMNHLPFKPDPPFLLASLLAHTGDSQVGMELSEAAIVAAAQETMPPPEEPTDLDMELEPAPSMDTDTEEVPSLDIELEAISSDESDIELYPASSEAAPLPIEEIEFEKEEPAAVDELVEVSTGEYTSSLDEETLSLELEDLLEAEKKSEPGEEREPDEEAMTVEMDAVAHLEPSEADLPSEPAASLELEEEEVFDSFDMGDAEDVEEGEQPHEEVKEEPPVSPPEPPPGDLEELFSPDNIKGYKIGQFHIPTQPSPGKNEKQTPSSGEPQQKAPPGAKGVWDEITKDLEDLEFDIDEP